MQIKTFTSGRIRAAHFDPGSGHLELHWDSKLVLAYKQVPQEVYRRLCSAPNPAAYWEDRIAEEYPKATPLTKANSAAAQRKFTDIFGGEDDPGQTHDDR